MKTNLKLAILYDANISVLGEEGAGKNRISFCKLDCENCTLIFKA
jgi:hypothetical protein